MQSIDRRRVLIVEDNALIGEHIAAIIEGAGGVPLGPVCSREEARDALDNPTLALDAAVLDLRLDGMSLMIADQLRGLGIPFVFATGDRGDIPAEYRFHPVCEKPFTPQGLMAALHRAIEARPRYEQTEGIDELPDNLLYFDPGRLRSGAA